MVNQGQSFLNSQFNREQAESLYRQFSNNVFTYVVAHVLDSDMAADILQDCFLQLFRKLESGNEILDPQAYLISSARNACIDMTTRLGRERQLRSSISLRDKPQASRPISKERKEQLSSALGELPANQREILFLKCFRDMTFKEISEHLQLPLATVSSRYRYGLEKMRAQLKV